MEEELPLANDFSVPGHSSPLSGSGLHVNIGFLIRDLSCHDGTLRYGLWLPPASGSISDVTLHVGTMIEVKGTFLRVGVHSHAQYPRPSARENERLETIVRLPIADDRDCIPVGVVSKDYALLQHSSVFDEAIKALENAEIDPARVDAELRLTELGERMKLSLCLPDDYLFDPGDKCPMTVRLECLNSVDGSTRFRAVMGWFRLVCSNGLTIGITRSESDLRHVGDLHLKHIGDVLRTGINEYKLERDVLIRWLDADVSENDLRKWAENELKAHWGFKAASRAWHIARTGRDVKVLGPYKKHSPTTVPVKSVSSVPGSPEESTSLFDVSQILAWLAKERTDIQQQMEWREQIPTLMAALAKAA